MVKVVQGDIPPEWEIFWNRIVRWYNLKGIPCFSRLWSQKMRRMNEVRYTISDFRSVGTAWSQLAPATQILWRNAANKAWAYNRGYRLFTADYIYRLIAGLSVPGSPSDYHQLFGLKMANPSPSTTVEMYRDDKDVVGKINLKINWKKVEIAFPPGGFLTVGFKGWYLTEGGIEMDFDGDILAPGNVNWREDSFSWGVVDREYFHVRILLNIFYYDAEVYLNNIIMSDKNGEFYNENFITERNTPWVPSRLYRKKDWMFTPDFVAPYFEHLYLQE